MIMRRLFVGLARHALLFLVYGGVGAVLALLVGAVWLSLSRIPDLKPWHEARLDEEFTRSAAARIADIAAYQALEERLFDEVAREVYDRVDVADQRQLNRYFRGSLSDPTGYAEDGNRTYELAVEAPRAAVLLLHGLSDSPYSLRPLAERLRRRGAHVVGLRLPGHGTAPSSLLVVEWQDWTAAVRMAMRDLRGRLGPTVPIYIVGYSTGAALAVEYTIARVAGEDLPAVEGLVLLSPAIGVAPITALASWQARLALLPGLGKLAWTSVAPEYDPYKYGSFTVNSGKQVYELTRALDNRLGALAQAGPLAGFPRTLVLQSAADDTVSPEAIVQVFLSRLAPGAHKVVAFDINRYAEAGPLLRADLRDPVELLLRERTWPFDVTVLTNASVEGGELVALHRAAGESAVTREPTALSWPRGIFSLSHVALIMPPDDPIYGAQRPPPPLRVIYLGRPALLGERGLLALPESALMRLRFNPFFDYMEDRVARHMGIEN